MSGLTRVLWLLLGILWLGTSTGCSPRVTPNDSTIYRTTEGVKHLSFQLSIWPPNKAGQPKIITNAQAGGLDGGFRWQLKPDGDNVQLELSGRNDRLAMPARGVVALSVDGQPAFFGILPDPANPGSKTSEKLTVLGGREALRKALSDGKAYRNMGVYAIARDLLSRLLPPSLTYDPKLIGDGSGTDAGPTLSTFYLPFQPLTDVLDSLAKSAGVTAGVDSQGRVFLGRPAAAALTVAYAGQPWRRLEVQGRETVTRALVRIATAPSVPNGATAYPSTSSYLPYQFVQAAEAPEHALYRAEEVFSVPEGVSVLSSVIQPYTASQNVVSPEKATDGEQTTAATLRVGKFDRLKIDVPGTGRIVGFQITYLFPSHTRLNDGDANIRLFTGNDTALVWNVPDTDTLTTTTVILPPNAASLFFDGQAWDTKLWIETNLDVENKASGNDLISIYDVRFLVVDEVAAARVAASYLQLPYATPAEMTLPGLYAPTPALTVTGSPDGDVSGDTALWEYEHSQAAVRTTRIKLGATGQGETARAIKFAVQAGR